MKLFHFTAFHHLVGGLGHPGPGIDDHGLRPNAHPLIGLPPMVWLTDDDWWGQCWSPRVVPGVDCDRTEIRLRIVIPKSARERLLPYGRVRLFVRSDWVVDFEGGFDLSGWSVFLGRIPRSWIRGITARPDLWAARELAG